MFKTKLNTELYYLIEEKMEGMTDKDNVSLLYIFEKEKRSGGGYIVVSSSDFGLLLSKEAKETLHKTIYPYVFKARGVQLPCPFCKRPIHFEEDMVNEA